MSAKGEPFCHCTQIVHKMYVISAISVPGGGIGGPGSVVCGLGGGVGAVGALEELDAGAGVAADVGPEYVFFVGHS
jgi:hypothetical protein